jgi:hypothetical protein
MTTSRWCDREAWYDDENFLIPSKRIPINKIDDINIEVQNYTYTVRDNYCFVFIPSLTCNNLHIVPGVMDSVGDIEDVIFYCEQLRAVNVIIDPHVICKHWDNSLCEWSVNSLSGEVQLYNVQCQASDFIRVNNGNLTKGYLNANSISLNGCSYKEGKIQSSNINISGNSTITSVLLNGKCNIDDSSLIRCTGNGEFNFLRSENLSTIFGTINFDSSINNGIVYGQSIFSGNGINGPNGILVGDCIFIDSINQGTVSGNAIFSGLSFNSGIVIQKATFTSGTINAGLVGDSASFKNSENSWRGTVFGDSQLLYSQNNGLLLNNSSLVSGNNNGTINGKSISFIASINDGEINAKYSATGEDASSCRFVSSINNNTLIARNISLVGSTVSEGAIIQCEVIGVGSGSVNNGSITAISCSFANTTTNNGTISPGTVVPTILTPVPDSGLVAVPDYANSYQTGEIIFNYGSFNYGTVRLGCITTFNNTLNFGTIYGESIFNGISTNLGTTFVSTSFKNKSTNSPQGTSNGTTHFLNDSINRGTVTPFGLFTDNSINSGINRISFSTFSNTSKNFANIEVGLFYNQSINHSFITNSGNFSDTSKNSTYGSISGAAVFRDNSINSGNFTSAYVRFYDDSINFYNALANNSMAIFYNRAQNKGMIYNGEFHDLSRNNGTGLGQFNFMDTSYNYGALIGDCRAWFLNYSTNKGIINTDAARFFDHSKNEYRISGCPGTLTFEDFSINAATIEDTDIVFMDSSINKGTLVQNDTSTNSVIFYDSGINDGNILNYSYVYFTDQAINKSVINTSHPSIIVFNGSANNGDIAASSGSAISFISATNIGNIREGTINFNASINYGIITSGIFNVFSTNFATINYGFFNGGNNFGNLVSGTFIQSQNSGNILKDAIFDSYSFSNGNIGGDARFNNHSINYGTINGSGGFFTYSCNYGIVLGELLTDFSCSGSGGGGGGGGSGGGGGGGSGEITGVEWVGGCTDPFAINYNSLANYDNGSCSGNILST